MDKLANKAKHFNILFRKGRAIMNDEKGIEKSNKSLSGVPIQNPEDITEVAVKTKTEIGQIFPNGFNELIKTIGVENLNMKDRHGYLITDGRKIFKGKRRYKAEEILKQYVDIYKMPEERYAIQIADIYIEPFLTVFDGRGKHSSGYYIKRLTPLIINKFLLINERISQELKKEMEKQGRYVQHTNVSQIARDIGLVDEKYGNIKYDELADINPKFTIKMVSDFYGNANRELEKIIFKILDNLQDNYSVISYKKNFCIHKNEQIGTKTIEMTISSNDDENSIIRKTQVKVLKEFNAKGLFTIYKRNQQKQFYKRVVELINTTYGFNWINYWKQIEIQIEDPDALKKLQNEYITDISQLDNYLYESKQRLIKRLCNLSQADYKCANKKEISEKKAAILENPDISNEFKELLECDLYTIEDMICCGIISKEELPNAYHYWESNLDTQFNLIEFFIGKRDNNFTDEESCNINVEI